MAFQALVAHGLLMPIINFNRSIQPTQPLILTRKIIMKTTIYTLLFIAALMLNTTAFAEDKKPDPTKFVTTSVTVSGAIETPLTLTVDDLRKFPPQQIGELPLVCQTGANVGKLENLKGVLLRDILEKAVVKVVGHNDAKKMAIIASASDDYRVVFSWSEVFNSSIGEGVIVFFEKDGSPLTDDEGRIAMISTKDTRTGPRHVKWLNNIEVRKIVD